jgi:hypothetical protein
LLNRAEGIAPAEAGHPIAFDLIEKMVGRSRV